MPKRPSLEHLIESEHLGVEILHPGGAEITRELAALCNVRKGTSVLDVAAGTGETACYLAETLGAQVVGVDLSDRMVERARGKARQKHLAVEVKKGDAHQLPFPDNAFDVVISECTMCILEKERALREMARVVAPGGYVGFHDICWIEDTPERFKRRLAEIENERPETLEGWKTVCERAGLVDIQAHDRSSLIPAWMKEAKASLGFGGMLKIVGKVVGHWGFTGLKDIWESQRIFGSRYTGYGIVVARKPSGS